MTDVLDLASNNLAGPIPTELGLLTNLKPPELPTCNRIHCDPPPPESVSLPFGFQEISPSELGQLTLLVLDISRNQLSGTIPSELGISNSILKLDYNLLSGTIPSEIGETTELYLSNNRLTGMIPSELGLYSGHIAWLDLASNKLTGSIPAEVASEYALVLILNDNQLSGTVPAALANFLIGLSLHENNLSGTMPLSYCDEQPYLKPPTIDCGEIEFACCKNSATFDCSTP